MTKKRNKNRVIFLYFGLFLLLIGISGCDTSRIENSGDVKNDIHKFEIPVYPGAIKKETSVSKNNNIKGVSYKLKKYYPAEDVLAYYEKEMKNLHYNPFAEDYLKYADRNWQTFSDSVQEGKPYIAQLTADWIDFQKNTRAKLVLRYFWYGLNKSSPVVLTDNENLNVIFQIMPFYILPDPDKLKEK